MQKKTCFVVILLFAALLLSCTRGSSALIDGYYTAEAAEFDAYGWKEYLSIRVSGGEIIVVEYNAYNASGFIKSWDMNHMRAMNASNGTYPNEYARHYAALFLKYQGIDRIDALSGASHSYPVFIGLAEAVLENAWAGKSRTTLVYFGDSH